MPRAVQRATAADVPYSMSSGCATTQSTRWKDSSGSAGNVMSGILPELSGHKGGSKPVSSGKAGLENVTASDAAVSFMGGTTGRKDHASLRHRSDRGTRTTPCSRAGRGGSRGHRYHEDA